MKTVTGVFASQESAARAAQKLASGGVRKERINLLLPGQGGKGLHGIPVSEAEQPGEGKALGGVMGAAVGLAGGLELGAAVAAAIPGVGPVIALGLAGAAILGLAGGKVGAALDNASTEGLPEDEIFVYEDALRHGKSVLMAFADDEAHAERLRKSMAAEGAESVDAAREKWWIGLRGAQQEHYSKGGRDFKQDEKFYRLGFEAALHARTRCKEYDQMLAEMDTDLEDLQKLHPGADLELPFRQGYERGRDYYQSLCGRSAA